MKEQRLVFGDEAELYDRIRPSYPPELIDGVVELVGAPCRVLDAGCGTGKATVMLAARGTEGVGVEPHPAMAAVAERRLQQYDGWHIEVSDFETWQPRTEDFPFDLVTAAQAWHWFNRELATSQAERFLRKGGWLVIFGHMPNPPDTPLRREIDAVYSELAPNPSARSQAPEERVTPGSAFGAPIERDYPGFQDYSAEEWTALMRTSSDHKILPPKRRELLLSKVAEAIERHGGQYRHHFIVKLWAAERR